MSQIQNEETGTFFSRLEQALRLRERTLPWLAKEARLSVSTVYRWKDGAIPQERVMDEIAKVLKVRKEWLEDGKEPMLQSEGEIKETEVLYRCTSRAEPLDAVAEALIQHLDPMLLAKVLADYITAAERGDGEALKNARKLVDRIRVVRPELLETERRN